LDTLKVLYIIDGQKETSKEKVHLLKSEDIEHIDVIKGEKALKLYGDEAKNGVVIITTKKKITK